MTDLQTLGYVTVTKKASRKSTWNIVMSVVGILSFLILVYTTALDVRKNANTSVFADTTQNKAVLRDTTGLGGVGSHVNQKDDTIKRVIDSLR